MTDLLPEASDEPIELDREYIRQIKIDELLPLLSNDQLLSHYADDVLQAQLEILNQLDFQPSFEMTQAISDVIGSLKILERHLTHKPYSRLKKWLGFELEQQATLMMIFQQLETRLQDADDLSVKVVEQLEYQRDAYVKLNEYRFIFLHYLTAVEEFLHEYPKFNIKQNMQHMHSRLENKVNTLKTSQQSNELSILQLQAAYEMALNVLDRFTDAKNVLLPAWLQNLKAMEQSKSTRKLQLLDRSRNDLIKALTNAIKTD